MPLTFTPETHHGETLRFIGDLYLLVGTLTFAGSYATGGDTVAGSAGAGAANLADFFKKVGRGKVLAIMGQARGNTLEYDSVADKLKVFSAANTELAAGAYAAALTASPVPVVVLGR